MAAALPGRCGFFLEKKNRFCKMIPARGHVFCGEHATMEEGSSNRIPCPLDPKHTVSEDKLKQHLKKCNAREKAKPVYYVENINSGSTDGETLQQVSLSGRSRAELQSLLDKLKTAVTGLQWDVDDSVLSHPALQEELNNPKNGDSAHKHLKQQSSLLGHLEALGLLGRGRCFVEFGAGRGKLSHWIHEALKTRDQLKTCEDLKTRDQLKTCEDLKTRDQLKTCEDLKTGDQLKTCEDLKTGDQLKTCEDLQLLLVERCSTRFKVDGKHQDPGVQFERLQVDIQHLDLSKVQLLRQKKLPLVGVGKHLCGAATDLALRCLLGTPGLQEEEEPPPKRLRTSEPDSVPELGPGPDSGSGPGPVLGVAVALCCHHRCEWRHYVGRRFFLQNGLGEAEFSAFCRMSSWATCGRRPANRSPASQGGTNQRRDDEDDEEHEPVEETDAVSGFLQTDQREEAGRLCKRLIDSGRLHFLETNGFSSKLTRYVSSQVTLENVLLTAVPSG